MPLTDQPVVVEGGCNCRAVRYRITVPAHSERPMYIGGGGETDPPVRAPVICTDHCNDCRAATGSILPTWFLAPLEMVSTSFVRRESSVTPDGRLDKKHPRGPWRPASEAFQAPAADPDTYLAFFKSSKGRRRGFCARCGTMFAYQVHPTPARWPGVEFLDLVLGTIDREYLEREDLRPERQLWWDRGISWVQRQSMKGLNVPIHPSYSVTEAAEDRSSQ